MTSVLSDPKLFLNRELSWLAFNERVLEEAKTASLPLFERLKFIGIVGCVGDRVTSVALGDAASGCSNTDCHDDKIVARRTIYVKGVKMRALKRMEHRVRRR